MQHGYGATTMSRIAAAMGGSKGTLWSYFHAKEALFAAVLDRASQAFRDEISGLLDPIAPIDLTLRRAMRRLQERLTAPRTVALYRLIVAEAARFPEVGRIYGQRVISPGIGVIADYLAGQMAAGRLRQADPALAARQLRALVVTPCQHQLLINAGEPVPAAQMARDVEAGVAAFLRAYAPDLGWPPIGVATPDKQA